MHVWHLLVDVSLSSCLVTSSCFPCTRGKPSAFISGMVSKLRLETYGAGDHITRQGEKGMS